MGRSKWTEDRLQELVDYFHNCKSVAVTASAFGVSRIRIYQLLKQAGVSVKGRQANLGPVTEAAIINIEENTTNAY